MENGPERHFPKWAGFLVTIVALAIVAFLVSLAFKSSKSPAADGDSSPSAAQTDGPGSSGAFLTCTDCHKNLDLVLTNGGPVDQLLNYTHKLHFSKGVSDCANCHPLPAHEPDKVNKPTMGRCFVCHGTSKTAIAPGTCVTCHPPGSRTIPTTHTQGNWLKDHPQFALNDPFECASCHTQTFCQNCHGLPQMPHPDGWGGEPHVQTFFKTGFPTCQNCHQVGSTPEQDAAEKGQDFCDQCHHQWGPKNTPWIKYHPTVVKEGNTAQCFQCHSPITCATCHVKGIEDLKADQTNFPTQVPGSPVASPSGTPSSASNSPEPSPTG